MTWPLILDMTFYTGFYNYFYIPVYIDASTDCNNLEFVFGQSAVGISNLATRSITIKASQLACGDSNLAPSGCSQYYWGTGGASTIKSFGYDASGPHLADQAQTICVRRESGKILAQIICSTGRPVEFLLAV